jgi:hypothetical protein
MTDLDPELYEHYRKRGVSPTITLLYFRSGRTADFPRWSEQARMDIACGEAIETEPSDPEFVAAWRKEVRDKAIAEWQKLESSRHTNYFDGEDPLPILNHYERWCEQSGRRAFPAEETTVLLWLLSRAAEGETDYARARSEAALISIIHSYTRHPPSNLSKRVVDGFTRATGFARARLTEDGVNVHTISAKAPAKALEMFPDGIVPRQYHEVAA